MKTSTTTTKNAFTVNFFVKQIEGTKTAFTRASKPGTNEYNELIVLMERHPSFKLHALEPKKHITGSKKTYEGLTKDFMKEYISIKPDSAVALKELDAVEKMANDKATPAYPLLKKWFLKKFKDFNIDKAKEEISNARIAEAEAAASANDSDRTDVVPFEQKKEA